MGDRNNDRQIQCDVMDDHPLLLKGLKQLLEFESDVEVGAEATNGPDAIHWRKISIQT